MLNMRHFASVPSPLAAQPVLITSAGGASRPTILEPTLTMKHVPYESSSIDHAFVLPAAFIDSPVAQELTMGPPPRPIDITQLSHCDSLFDELQQTASDLGSWLNIIQDGLDDVLSTDKTTDTELQESGSSPYATTESPRAVL
jgi:hypothetical protein